MPLRLHPPVLLIGSREKSEVLIGTPSAPSWLLDGDLHRNDLMYDSYLIAVRGIDSKLTIEMKEMEIPYE